MPLVGARSCASRPQLYSLFPRQLLAIMECSPCCRSGCAVAGLARDLRCLGAVCVGGTAWARLAVLAATRPFEQAGVGIHLDHFCRRSQRGLCFSAPSRRQDRIEWHVEDGWPYLSGGGVVPRWNALSQQRKLQSGPHSCGGATRSRDRSFRGRCRPFRQIVSLSAPKRSDLLAAQSRFAKSSA